MTIIIMNKKNNNPSKNYLGQIRSGGYTLDINFVEKWKNFIFTKSDRINFTLYSFTILEDSNEVVILFYIELKIYARQNFFINFLSNFEKDSVVVILEKEGRSSELIQKFIEKSKSQNLEICWLGVPRSDKGKENKLNFDFIINNNLLEKARISPDIPLSLLENEANSKEKKILETSEEKKYFTARGRKKNL